MLEASQAHVVTDDVQHSHHLAEDQHPAWGTTGCKVYLWVQRVPLGARGTIGCKGYRWVQGVPLGDNSTMTANGSNTLTCNDVYHRVHITVLQALTQEISSGSDAGALCDR